GIIAFNRELESAAADAVMQQFVELVIAPKVSAQARALLAEKSNVRVLEVPLELGVNVFDTKRVGGGLLVQTPDVLNLPASNLKCVTRMKPTDAQLTDLLFAWRVAKFVKSNA